MSFIRWRMQKILGRPISTEAPRSFVSYGDSGPDGVYDMWRHSEDKEHNWQQTKTLLDKKNKPKIIFSNPLARRFRVDQQIIEEEREFYEALCNEYDVYLWPGDSIPLRDCNPVTADELITRMKDAVPATAEKVKDTLSLQNRSSDEFIFWDYAADTQMHRNCFEAFLGREQDKSLFRSYFNLNMSPTEIDISTLDAEEFEILKKSVDFTTIKKIRMKYSMEITPDMIIAQFPNLEKLTLIQPPQSWLDDYLPTFPEKLHIELTEIDQTNIRLPKKTLLQKLTLSSSQNLQIVDATTATIKELEIDSCNDFHRVATYEEGRDQIETLRVTNIKNAPAMLDVTRLPNLQEFIVHNFQCDERFMKTVGDKIIDLEYLKNLRRYEMDNSLIGPKAGFLSANKCPKLKEVCIALPPGMKVQRPSNLPEEIQCTFKTLLPEQPIQKIKEELYRYAESKMDLKQSDIHATPDDIKYTEFSDKRRLITNRINDNHRLLPHLPYMKEAIFMLLQMKVETKGSVFKPFCTSLESLRIMEIAKREVAGIPYDINLSDMTELKEFSCILLDVEKIVLPPPKNLTRLFLYTSTIKTLDLSDYTELESVTLHHFTNVIFPRPPNKLKRVHLNGNSSETLDFTGSPDLQILHLEKCNNLTQVNIIKNAVLEKLTVKRCPELKFDGLTHLPHLRYANILQCHKCHPINFSAAKKLTDARITSEPGVKLGDINFTNCSALENITLIKPAETKLILDGCHSLRTFNMNIEGKQKIQITLPSGLPKLRNVTVDGDCAEEIANTIKSNLSEEEQTRCVFDVADSNDEADVNATFQLDQRNKHSKIACFKYGTEDTIDANVGGSVIHRATKEDLKVALYCQKDISANNYRINLIDAIQATTKASPLKKGEKIVSSLKFCAKKPNLHHEIKLERQKTTLSTKLIEEKKTAAKIMPDKLTGYFEGTLAQGAYALPCIQSIENPEGMEVITDPPNAIRLFHDPGKQQYYFSPAPHAANKPIKILYSMPFHFNADKELKEEKCAVANKNLLDPIVIDRMIAIFKHKIAKAATPDSKVPCAPGFKALLNVMLNDKIDSDAKIRHIMDYCSQFKKALFTPKEAKLDFPLERDLEILCNTIVYQKGSCRHRARAAMLLSHWNNTPVQMPQNERHQFCEVPVIDAEGHLHFRVKELGGGDMQDFTAANVRAFDDSKMPRSAPEQKTTSTQTIADQLKQTIQEAYYQKFRSLVEATELKSLSDIVNPIINKESFILPPLIELQPNQRAADLKQELYRQLREKKFDVTQKFIYINTPEQFKRFLQPLCLLEGKWSRKKGPLSHMIEEDGGVIVVNWSNFSATEAASYKSILDSAPMLFDLALPKTSEKEEKDRRPLIKVIGITKNETKECSAFKSRCKPMKLARDFPFSKETKEEMKTNITTKIEIDLFHRNAWREAVFGKFTYDDGKITLEPSEFLKAVIAGKPFEVIFNNPPVNHSEFDSFIREIRDEKRLFFEDKFIPLHADTVIKTAEKKYDLTLPHNIHVNEEKDFGRRKTYIGINQLNTLIEQIIFSEKDRGTTKDGLLKTFDAEKDIFYLTDSISQDEWQALLADIRKKYPGKNFHFQTAPGIEIEDVPQSKLALNDANALPNPKRILTSNDPDMATMLAAKEEKNPVLVIDVTAETELKDLLIEVRSSQGESLFHYRESEMLKALREVPPRTVILNGELSPALYKRLMPLFTHDAHIHCNGERIKMTGKLMWVMPTKTQKNIPLLRSSPVNFAFDDYRKHFGKPHTKSLDQIESFYSLVNRLPHRGEGMPPFPELSRHHLANMIQALEQKSTLHPHNPIKHLFLFDYLKKSEEYAYINVMAKCSFRADDAAPQRHEKLAKLIREYGITTPDSLNKCLFRILNCFNGAELKKILGEKFENILFSSTMPALNDTTLKNLFSLITQPAPSHTAHKKKDRNKKQLEELDSSLNDPDSPYILLKGSTGVGKTFAVRQLDYCEEKNILDWLQGKKKYLLLDEANMATPGKWNFLKGLSRPDHTVYYEGVKYTLSKNQKVFFTGNPENYPGRFYHRFLQQYAKTLYIKKPTDDYLKQEILQPLLLPKLNQYQDDLLFAYHLIEKFNPFLTSSFRDIKGLTSRFVFLTKEKSDTRRALLDACIGEYAGAIRDISKRNRFIAELSAKFKVPLLEEKSSPVLQVTPDLMITREKNYLLKTVEQDLHQRMKAMQDSKENTPVNYKTALLVEGNPGAGKSTLLKEILIRNKIEFIQIAAGSPDTHAQLKKAFRERKVVLLEEFNLDEKLEELLNQLLSGTCDGKAAEGPGFMVIASQNTTTTTGRKTLSPALLDRTHFIYMDVYLKQELIELSKAHKIKDPELFVDAFLQICADFPDRANMRTFYTLLNQYAEKTPEPLVEEVKEIKIIALEEKKSSVTVSPKRIKADRKF